jgi:hypothetical protein
MTVFSTSLMLGAFLVAGHTGADQLSQEPKPLRRVAAVAQPSCPVAVRSAETVASEQGDLVRLAMSTSLGEPLDRLEITAVVYSADGRVVTTIPYYIEEADLPRADAPSTVSIPAPVVDESELLRVGVSSAAPGGEGCSLDGLRAAADAEFDPPEVTVLNLPGAPLRISLSGSAAQHDKDGRLTRVQFVVADSGPEDAWAGRVGAFVFEYGSRSGPVLRVMASDIEMPLLRAGQSTDRSIALRLPEEHRYVARWKVVLVLRAAKMPGHDWKGEDLAEKAMDALRHSRQAP